MKQDDTIVTACLLALLLTTLEFNRILMFSLRPFNLLNVTLFVAAVTGLWRVIRGHARAGAALSYALLFLIFIAGISIRCHQKCYAFFALAFTLKAVAPCLTIRARRVKLVSPPSPRDVAPLCASWALALMSAFGVTSPSAHLPFALALVAANALNARSEKHPGRPIRGGGRL
jgi:hypothetical protein